uniref:Uncharacterized protein n=1 Tax=Romanomermis culicivorax TaxID=13658 RepID=A0A915HPH1_ROMCU
KESSSSNVKLDTSGVFKSSSSSFIEEDGKSNSTVMAIISSKSCFNFNKLGFSGSASKAAST